MKSFSGDLKPFVPEMSSLPGGTPCHLGSFRDSFQSCHTSPPWPLPALPVDAVAYGAASCCWVPSAPWSGSASGSRRAQSYWPGFA
eukprot:7793912-Heterocapsa_arctica.AAC.1